MWNLSNWQVFSAGSLPPRILGETKWNLMELPFRMTFVATQRSSVGGMTSEPTTICPEHHIAEFIHECCREVPINHPNSRIARHDI
jgi:hypothetical protein